MKKLIAALLVFALILSVAGCSLFSDNSIVKFEEYYTHKDPDKLTYDERIVMMSSGFEATLEEYVNSAAYPDTMMYDEEGNIVGMYDYDPQTGLAKGWISTEDGSYTAYAEGEEVDLGMSDATLMVEIPGTIDLGFVVYGNKGEAVCTCMYAFLSDAAAGDVVIENMEVFYGISMEKESDTVLKATLDQDVLAADFAMSEESYGETIDPKDAAAYAQILQMNYGAREYGGVNPYEPYAEHEDPADLDFDERAVMTGAGDYAVPEGLENDIQSVTDYIYAKDDVVIAQYTYYEFSSKDGAEKAMKNDYFADAERVSDTVFLSVMEGTAMEETLTTYIGYSVLSDKSLDSYVKMIEEAYFSVLCE